MTAQEQLLREIQDFITKRGIKETTFGRFAVNDGKFVQRLRDGKNVGVNLIARARDYMRDHADEKRLQPAREPANAHAGDKPGSVLAIAEEDLEPDQENDGGCE